ncbi:MAG: 16S rRNA (cytosine(1402)-N(4))-methyltransferase RsmH [Chitinophagaceae bacterium]|nr:16S rRNA (cytosine(1402)-N(4))-methyltransferase RsmH [Chitinophagaceae bacterium]
MNEQGHIPVLLQETMDALNIQPGGIYVDCTYGGGGHASEILKRLNQNGRLFAFDQDAESAKRLIQDSRLTFIPQNFRYVQRFLRLEGIGQVDGILADLGMSSFQLDSLERGFSMRTDAKLDMRMDRRKKLTAADVLNTYPEDLLRKLFSEYGELPNAKKLAKRIVEIRQYAPIHTVNNLKNAIREMVLGNPNRYFARVFQALRIEVNDELGALKELLLQIPELLKTGGRVAIITFHSLEDRIVKYFFRYGSFEIPEINSIYETAPTPVLKPVTKKPIQPGENEIKRNPRSRSARLRVAEKTEVSRGQR